MLRRHDEHLSVTWPDGRTSRYHWVWLRDSCTCPQCFNSNCRQRYFDSSRIPLDVKPSMLDIEDGSLRICWTDQHVSEFSLDWLCRNEYEHRPRPAAGLTATAESWDRIRVRSDLRFDRQELFDDDRILAQAYDALFRYGLVVVDGDGGSASDFPRLCERLSGFLDRTYFGEFYDLEVKPDATTDSISFSTRELPLHTDIPYYTTPPDFQFLFGLDVSPECAIRGIGDTRFVDGFAAAYRLRADWPDLFDTLTRTPVVYRASYPWVGKLYENNTPIITLAADGSVQRIVNNPTKMFFDGVSFDEMLPLFTAYRAFKGLLADDLPAYSHRWRQGDLVLWDNRRIFHGRGEFGAGNVTRTLRGGYFGEIELRARARFLGRPAEAVRDERVPQPA